MSKKSKLVIISNAKNFISLLLILTVLFSNSIIPALAVDYGADNVIIHYYNENNWENPYVYYYYGSNEGYSWPGVAMNNDGDGWFSYEINGYTQANVIFSNNGSNQYPEKNQEGLFISGEKWFKSGTLYDKDPNSNKITVHYYNTNSWSNPYIYYYTENIKPITWPGAGMTYDGNGWYSYDIYGFDEAKVIFSNNGSNQIPQQNQEGYTVSSEKWFVNGTWYNSEPNGITVHFYNYKNWNNVNIYYYSGSLEGTSWTGIPMNNDGNNWYTYKIYGLDEARVLFNNGSNEQIPEAMQEGFLVSGEMWYVNGTWTEKKPDEITVYFYKPDGWSAPNMYYYLNDNNTGPAWPGVAMEEVSEGWYSYTIKEYPSAKILFNDGNNQIPDKNQPGFDVNTTVWYKDGVLCDMKSDTDKDGLLDYTEILIGTDINNPDTDNDNIPDGYEVNTLHSNPLLVDSDEDYDNDNLSNYLEYVNNTNPNNVDTDGDGLNDYEELNVYGTNPLLYDTDEDGLGDYAEIQAGLNPLLSDSDNDGVSDGGEVITQNITLDKYNTFDIETAKVIPSVSITGTGDYNTKLSAKDISYNKEISGLSCIVGSPYEFEHDDELTFEKCTLSFEINKDVYKENNITDLAIAWYDEINHTINPIETKYDEKRSIIYGDVTHFSKYFVINEKEFLYNILINENADISDNEIEYKEHNGHYYSVINESLPWDEAMNYCASLGGHLVTIQSEEEQNFITNLVKDNPKKNTYWIGLTGEDNHYSWITGEPLDYENWDSGEPNTPIETVVHLYAKDMPLSSIGRWNDTLNAYDGGDTYYYSYKNCGIICEWEENPDNNTTAIKLTNGELIFLKSDPVLEEKTDAGIDPYSIDSDGDGIPDKIELLNIVTVKTTVNGKEVEYEAWDYISDPSKADSDGDGLTDLNDSEPLNFNILVSIPEGGNESCLKLNTGKYFNAYYGDINQLLISYYNKNIEIFDYTSEQEYNRLFVNNLSNYTCEEYVALSSVCLDSVKLRIQSENVETKNTVYQHIVGNAIGSYVPKDYEKANSFWNIVSESDAVKKYFNTAITQALFGRYAGDNINTLGTVLEVGASLLGVDIFQDLRDLSHDLTHLKGEWEDLGKIAIDSVGLVPLVGVIKNSDECVAIVKRSDHIYEARKLSSNIKFIVKDGIRYLDSAVKDIYTDVSKNINKLGNKVYSNALKSLQPLKTKFDFLEIGFSSNPFANSYSNFVLESIAKYSDEANELQDINSIYFDKAIRDIGEKAAKNPLETNNITKETFQSSKRAARTSYDAIEDVLQQIDKKVDFSELENNQKAIAKIDAKYLEHSDDIARSVARHLREKINSKKICKTTGGKLRESVVTVAVDKSNGKIYYGISGPKKENIVNGISTNPTRRKVKEAGANKSWLDKRLEEVGEPIEIWPLNNCGEFNAINNAIESDNALVENLCLYSIYIEGGSYSKPCGNCRTLYSGYVNFIEE